MSFFLRDTLADRIARDGWDIGAHSYGAEGSPHIMDWGAGHRLSVGRYTSIAQGVTVFLDGEHRPDWVTTYPFSHIPGWPEAAEIKGHPHGRGDVRIGHDVWIGFEAVIMSGVTIGDGAVVGARAIVTRDVPPYAIVAGSPARVLRHRFPPETIARLLRIRWWDWPEERVHAAMRLLLATDIGAFLDAAEAGAAD